LQSRHTDVLGINNGQLGDDQLVYATLNYANGPGYTQNLMADGKRKDMKMTNMKDKYYQYPSIVPLESGTHGGDDVAIFASGPWAHLFTGVLEQNYIPHALAYASCIGDGLTSCSAPT
jgi:alkaline phosphatase